MVHIFNHPLIKHKLTNIRRKETGTKDFRETISEIGSLMIYEITRDLQTKKVQIETPMCISIQEVLDTEIVIIPILRAGLGMVEGIHNLIPTAKIGHVGLARDEDSLIPVEYYFKTPELKDAFTIIVDPMLATGGSLVHTIKLLKAAGANNIVFVGLVGAPEGLEVVEKEHPDVKIYLASLDEKLNDLGYIVPGLGDAGDRIFGTK